MVPEYFKVHEIVVSFPSVDGMLHGKVRDLKKVVRDMTIMCGVNSINCYKQNITG
jgi:hypothetical protein